jgi:hypothetical protein
VSETLPESVLAKIEDRLRRVVTVAPAPWRTALETREGAGGENFVQFLGDPSVDNEMYFTVMLGTQRLTSPDPRLDLIVDFVGNAVEDMQRLLDEVRRQRATGS